MRDRQGSGLGFGRGAGSFLANVKPLASAIWQG